MFCVAKEPLSQRQIEITVFRQNYLYKTKAYYSRNKTEKVAAPKGCDLLFSVCVLIILRGATRPQ